MIVSLVLSVFVSLAPGYTASFKQICAFGDSLTDTGNLYNATFGITPDSAHYYLGRFSNGPVWVEYFDQLGGGVPLQVFAYGGARTGNEAMPLGLLSQVQVFVQTTPIYPETLLTIWAGANDFFMGDGDFHKSVRNIMAALELLATHGAKMILVMNLVDLGATPALNRDPAAANAGRTFPLLFNDDLKREIAEFRARHPWIKLDLFDTFSAFRDLLAHPGVFGFRNTTDPCPSYGHDFSNRYGYVFWDDRHPTTEAHSVLARMVFNAFYHDVTQAPASSSSGQKQPRKPVQDDMNSDMLEGR